MIALWLFSSILLAPSPPKDGLVHTRAPCRRPSPDATVRGVLHCLRREINTTSHIVTADSSDTTTVPRRPEWSPPTAAAPLPPAPSWLPLRPARVHGVGEA